MLPGHMGIRSMSINLRADLSLTRLLQLISPALPIGSYAYSQGIEWAVESGWISDRHDLQEWLDGLLKTNMLYLELPILKRMIDAWSNRDPGSLLHWNEFLVASRETFELRFEESSRARAFYQLLCSLQADAVGHEAILLRSQSACYSFACQRWNIDFERAACGMLYSWLENQILSAVKIIPLGQTAGQQVTFALASTLPAIVDRAAEITDDDIGASSMALAIASSQHETQYTRLFRS